MAHEPLAYSYDAAWHCEGCALERFGRDAHGDIDGIDSEGNPVGVLAPWDEWNPDDTEPATLACDTCGGVIEEFTPPDYVPPFDIGDAREAAADWHGGQASALYALASSGTVLADALHEARECADDAREHYPTDTREQNRARRLVEWIEANPPQVETLDV